MAFGDNSSVINVDSLLDSIPGVVVVYRLCPDKFEIIYCSSGITDFSGRSPEEFLAFASTDVYGGVYPSDAKKVFDCLCNAAKKKEDVDITFRIIHKDNSLIWVRMKGKIVDVVDGFPIMYTVFLNISSESELYQSIIDETRTCILVCDLHTREVLYANKAALHFSGKKKYSYIGIPCYRFMKNLDAPCPNCSLPDTWDNTSLTITEYTPDNRCFQRTNHFINWNGREAYIEYAEDITAHKQNELYAQNAKSSIQSILSNVEVGIFVFQFHNNEKCLVEANTMMCTMLGISRKKAIGTYGDHVYDLVHPDDIPIIQRVEHTIRKPDGHICYVYRSFSNKTHSYLWLLARAKSVPQPDGSVLAYISYTDITEQKQLDESLRKNEQFFIRAHNQNGIWVWELDLNTHQLKAVGSDGTKRNWPMGDFMKNVPESIIAQNLYHPDSVPIVRDAYRRMYSGEKQVSVQIQCWSEEKKDYSWYQLILTAVDSSTGLTNKAICTSRDISSEMQLKQLYKLEIENRKNMPASVIASCRINLTQNMIEDFWLNSNTTCISISNHVKNITDYRKRIGLIFTDIRLSDEDNDSLSPQKLLTQYYEGTRELEKTFLATKKENNQLVWIQVEVKFLTNPSSGDITAFLYSQDVSKRVMREMVTRKIVNKNYDLVGYIVVSNEHFYLEDYERNSPYFATGYNDFSTAVYVNIKMHVPKEEQAAVAAAEKLKTILSHLEKEPFYTCQYHYINDDGRILVKQARYAYADFSNEFIIFSRMDMTETLLKSERAQNRLETALEAARSASQAKSDFFARMSHDIRTPMNAIIGLTALTLDENNLSETAKDNLSKIRSASDFLLGLVNDVLDMSKIEQGAIRLKEEPYRYVDFVSTLKTMFLPQCEQHGIHFEFEEAAFLCTLLTDKLRLNQLFFNILSNAIKYTPEGGTVSYQVLNPQLTDDRLTCDFLIADTGIGMSKEFQMHLFEPFAREDNSLTSGLQGTGLGLSIAKNLVELMGGRLIIKSTVGKGTSVRIHLSFALTNNSSTLDAAAPSAAPDNQLLFEKHLLLVEDHPLNMEIAKKLLEKKGAIVIPVVNGQLAIEHFHASSVGFFDAILMDIRMPVMDGISATTCIRKMNRVDAKVVPIIAMTANAYEKDVEQTREAGMNAHLSKPIQPQLLYSVLSQEIERYRKS